MSEASETVTFTNSTLNPKLFFLLEILLWKLQFQNWISSISWHSPNQPKYSWKAKGQWTTYWAAHFHQLMILGLRPGMQKIQWVMFWLLHSIQPEISKTYLILTFTKDIREDVTHMCSKKAVARIGSMKQGTKSITEYFNIQKRTLARIESLSRCGNGVHKRYKEVKGCDGERGTFFSLWERYLLTFEGKKAERD